MPVYNPVIIVATSSFQTEMNYQLVSSVFCRGENIANIKTPVNPEGYMVVDIHRHLENKLSFDFNPGTATGVSIATQSFASYSVSFSNEFRAEWNFVDNFYSVIGGTAFVGFVSQETPYFSVGESIYVSQDEGFTNASYNGTHEIVSITQSGLTWSITVDASWATATPAEGGVMTYANFDLTTISSTFSIGTKYAFNGVLSYLDFIDWDYDDWAANTSNTGKFFTNVPDYYSLDKESYMMLNVYQNSANEIKTIRVRSNLGTYSINNPFTTITPNSQQRFLQVNLSPRFLSNNGWIDDTTKSIEVWVDNQVTSKTITSKFFNIINNCSPYEKMTIIFMDKMGSFLPYTFNRVNRETKDIRRTTYQQVYGSYAPASQNWTYNTWDRGKKILDTVVTEQFTLNSEFVNQSTSDYLMELFECGEAYWVRPDGKIVAISITITSIERKQVINEQLINYVLTFELSNKNSSQRG